MRAAEKKKLGIGEPLLFLLAALCVVVPAAAESVVAVTRPLDAGGSVPWAFLLLLYVAVVLGIAARRGHAWRRGRVLLADREEITDPQMLAQLARLRIAAGLKPIPKCGRRSHRTWRPS